MKRILVLVLLFVVFQNCENTYANTRYEDVIDELDFDDVKTKETGVDFKSLVNEIVSGDYGESDGLMDVLKNTLLGQIKAHGKSIVNIFILAILSAVFTNFAGAFKNNNISETGIFVSLLAIMALLFSSFYLADEIAVSTIDGCITFLQCVIPVMAAAIAMSSGSVTALAANELMLMVITLVYYFFKVFVVKLAGVYAAFAMVNSLSKEKSLDKLCKLLDMIGGWAVKTMIGIVIGASAVQGLVIPVADSMKSNVLNKALSVIPGIGNGVSALSKTLIGASCHVKNSIGIACFVVILTICVVPVIKLAVFVLTFKFISAVLEPVCDKRIVNCIHDVSVAIKLQLSAVAAVGGLFMIAIGIICATTNAGYYAG